MGSGNKWYVTDYTHTWTGGVLTVTATTDVPCHLELRHTRNPVRLHNRERNLRGLYIKGNPYFCFTAWVAIEQNEPGDTLIHTFDWPDWTAGDLRNYYFSGTMNDVPSKSTSAIYRQQYDKGPVFSLGIYGEEEVLTGSAKLEAGANMTFTMNPAANTIRPTQL